MSPGGHAGGGAAAETEAESLMRSSNATHMVARSVVGKGRGSGVGKASSQHSPNPPTHPFTSVTLESPAVVAANVLDHAAAHYANEGGTGLGLGENPKKWL